MFPQMVSIIGCNYLEAFPVVANSVLEHRSASFFYKKNIVNILGFASIELFHCSVKSEIKYNMSGHSCVPIKLFMVTKL